jgi:iron complex transport system substrate-binding protein
MLASVASIADLFGVPERGATLVADLRARLARAAGELAAARAAGSASSKPPRVYVEVDWPPCFTSGRRSFVHEALVAAGGENVFGDEERAYFPTSAEAVVARRPDVVLVLHPLDRPLSDRPEFASLGGAASGPVVIDLGPDRDLLLRSSPRLVRGVELLATRLAAAAKVVASRR